MRETILARLAVLLQRHGELATRLQEVADDDYEPQVVDETEVADESAVLTGTQTSRQLIQMFAFDAAGVPGTGTLPAVQDDGEERLSTVEEASLSPGMLSGGGWSLDGDEYGGQRVVSPSILQTLVSRSVTPPPSLQRHRLHQHRHDYPNSGLSSVPATSAQRSMPQDSADKRYWGRCDSPVLRTSVPSTAGRATATWDPLPGQPARYQGPEEVPVKRGPRKSLREVRPRRPGSRTEVRADGMDTNPERLGGEAAHCS